MYGKKFKLQIVAVTPFTGNEGDTPVPGITITGTTIVKDLKWFDDIHIGKDRSGLTAIFEGTLPIDGAVSLKFSERDDEMLTFLKEKTPCKTTGIEIGRPNADGEVEVKLKLKVAHVTKKASGEFVAALRSEVEIQIDSKQQELF